MIPFQIRVLSVLMTGLAFQALPVQAQTAAIQGVAAASIPVAYAGDDTRVGVGYDSRDKVRGEVMHVLTGDDRSAWIGELWAGSQAGGLQLDYHWLTGDNARVAKLFAAWDRNKWGDQKVSVGGGAENESWFWGAYVSAAVNGRRAIGSQTAAFTETRQAIDPALGPYLQDFTTTTTTRSYERGYDQGIGGRVGRFYDRSLIRVTAGLDHEWGRSRARLTTASVGAEKFFAGSPHSILVSASVSDRHGDLDPRGQDRRAGIYWRYEFGGKGDGAWLATKAVRRVEDALTAVAPGPATTPALAAEMEKKVVRVAESVSAEAFFDLNGASLKPEARRVLDDLLVRLRGAVLDGRLRVIGHTCDLGPAAYNQRLSERRAGAVRDYLIGSGALPADGVEAVGKGENDPRYPNTRTERQKNRRCDIEFAIVVQKEAVPAAARTGTVPATAPAPGPGWHLEEVAATPAWYRRALHNPLSHKREVDVYGVQDKSVVVTAGPRTYLNQAPVAVNDWFWWFGSQMPGMVNVLANDSDPNRDPLRVIAVTNGANGDVAILPDGRLRYTWRIHREGIDTFSYTVSDGYNGTATAQVTIYVVDP